MSLYFLLSTLNLYIRYTVTFLFTLSSILCAFCVRSKFTCTYKCVCTQIIHGRCILLMELYQNDTHVHMPVYGHVQHDFVKRTKNYARISFTFSGLSGRRCKGCFKVLWRKWRFQILDCVLSSRAIGKECVCTIPKSN